MHARDLESRAIYIALIATMSPIVAATFIERRTFGAGSTLSMVLAALGLIGLLGQLRAAPTIPRARTRRSRGGGKR
jgi:hypothetical protein